MNIWIVEDDDTDAHKAAKTVVDAISETAGLSMRSVKLFWNPTVHWGSDLMRIDVDGDEVRLTERPVRASLTRQLAPTIVVLDLLDKGLAFTAGEFLTAMRAWELKERVDPAFVVIWSPHSGQKEVQDFYVNEPKRDWRLRWLETKAPVPLKRAVQGYLRLWAETQIQ